MLQLESQDRSKWDQDLITEGFHFLERSASEENLSEFHLEAAIDSVHSSAKTYENTDWRIQELYNLLYALKPTPIVALNRAVAVGYAQGPETGLTELGKIPDSQKLKDYLFYPAAQGEFLLLAGRPGEAEKQFESALKLARTRSEASFFERKVEACRTGAAQIE